ncbi:hypothetical protein KKG22_00725 [Patescibacteria group bacterium]|nr:hypothetical protein [Patescibacteria group bacterium]MBU1721914.1 hypothetical protein [Patescibacteria group bacterium]MBU1901207.1 hypothetical protein [Patescibacteria group bacterium]
MEEQTQWARALKKAQREHQRMAVSHVDPIAQTIKQYTDMLQQLMETKAKQERIEMTFNTLCSLRAKQCAEEIKHSAALRHKDILAAYYHDCYQLRKAVNSSYGN